ncbi:hypothetical protein TrVE_jg4612 [Triparma verrucosa]|uniref:Uncharacterized protein n=1 Tax=Triparma verrucosa TaxID=1606542 RepID=A0A9W7C0Y4_9STRA|nr:hypothetical protein TrVE_jg4612 [Triparma verrucosa]
MGGAASKFDAAETADPPSFSERSSGRSNSPEHSMSGRFNAGNPTSMTTSLHEASRRFQAITVTSNDGKITISHKPMSASKSPVKQPFQSASNRAKTMMGDKLNLSASLLKNIPTGGHGQDHKISPDGSREYGGSNGSNGSDRAESPSAAKDGFNAEVTAVPGKFLFVGLSNSGKTTLIELMSTSRKFQVHETPSKGIERNIDFMLPGEHEKVHDPISVMMSTEMKKSPSRKFVVDKTKGRKLFGDEDAGEGGEEKKEDTDIDTGKLDKVDKVDDEQGEDHQQEQQEDGTNAEELEDAEERKRSPTLLSTPPPVSRALSTVASAFVLPLPPPSTCTTTHQCVIRGHAFTALDTPGRPAFRHTWYENLSAVCCIIMVVDCSDWSSLVLAAEQVRRLSGKEGGFKVDKDKQLAIDRLPVLVLGNKKDLARKTEGIYDERKLAEVLQMDKWLRNEHGRMWTVRVVSAMDMDGVADSLLWGIEERWKVSKGAS